MFCDRCAHGYAGESCQYSDIITCNGRGRSRTNGTCKCSHPWDGESCHRCKHSYAGEWCQFSDMLTCNNNGTVQHDGSCLCGPQWTGATCNSCIPGYTGEKCDSPVCIVNLNDTSIPHPPGQCDSCLIGFAGSSCQYNDTVTCNGHGWAQYNGTCLCDPWSTGDYCQFGDAITNAPSMMILILSLLSYVLLV
jgi:hypothetical protein